MKLPRALVASLLAGALSHAGVSACSKDVDLGGASDASRPPADALAPDVRGGEDAEPPRAPCDPCASSNECGDGGTCALLDGGNGFCLVACPSGAGCGVDESCRAVTGVSGDRPEACVPEAGACTAPAPPVADGAPVDRCGELVGPSVAADCRSCTPSSSDCQPNGCYGGWWCQTYYRRCERPPKSC